jgi:type I restriction enzyme R subunit
MLRLTRKVTDPDGKEREEAYYEKIKGKTGEDVLTAFRNSFNPRIAVTVDMIATGTDVKPVEIIFFMRSVKSSNYFEQMKGRGVRVITKDELQGVTVAKRLCSPRNSYFCASPCLLVSLSPRFLLLSS